MDAVVSRAQTAKGHHLLRALQVAIGIGILALLVRSVGTKAVLTALSSVGPGDMLKTVLVFLVASLLLGGCLLVMFQIPTNRALAQRILQAHLAGVLLSDMTPARAGYFFTPILIERLAGIPKESGFAALAGMQAISLVTKAGLAMAAVLLLGSRIQNQLRAIEITRYVLAGSALLSGIAVIFAIIAWTPALEHVFRGIGRRTPSLSRVRLLQLCAGFIEKFSAGVRVGYVRAALASILSAASTIAAGLALYVVAQAVGLRELSMLDVVVVSTVVGPIMYLPVAPAGLGIIEAAYVLVLTAMGQPQSSALTFALVGRVLFTGTDIVGLPWLLMGVGRQSGPTME